MRSARVQSSLWIVDQRGRVKYGNCQQSQHQVQYSTVQYSTVHNSTIQYSTVQTGRVKYGGTVKRASTRSRPQQEVIMFVAGDTLQDR